jgi:hypothetical protein
VLRGLQVHAEGLLHDQAQPAALLGGAALRRAIALDTRADLRACMYGFVKTELVCCLNR